MSLLPSELMISCKHYRKSCRFCRGVVLPLLQTYFCCADHCFDSIWERTFVPSKKGKKSDKDFEMCRIL